MESLLSPDRLRELHESGLYSIGMSIETGDEHIRNKIIKKQDRYAAVGDVKKKALALLSERIVGTFLRLNEDGEWEKGKGAVAGFFGLTETDLNDIVDDLLFKLDSARKAA